MLSLLHKFSFRSGCVEKVIEWDFEVDLVGGVGNGIEIRVFLFGIQRMSFFDVGVFLLFGFFGCVMLVDVVARGTTLTRGR